MQRILFGPSLRATAKHSIIGHRTRLKRCCGNGAAVVVEFDHAIALRIVDLVIEDTNSKFHENQVESTIIDERGRVGIRIPRTR